MNFLFCSAKIKAGERMSVKISAVTDNSHAQKHNIKPGETLISINGNDIVDVLDYRFYQLNRELTLVISDESGKSRTVFIKKAEYDEIGLEFETYLMDKQHSCRNKCIFCFIDQLPKGLRKSLYFKDDDSRLSFLFGNYITLTNLTEHEISRIIKMHISPINVSVHTTNPSLRCEMMGNRFAGDALKILKRLSDANIRLNCQIVCCPGINDGKELEKTLHDLIDLNVEMVAIVPVGLTAHREGLYKLTPFDKEKAEQTLDIINSIGDECLEKLGRRVVFAADELFIKAERDIPDVEYYEDFPALENGVGLIAYLKDETLYALEEKEYDETINARLTIACGTSAAPFLRELVFEINKKFPNINVNVIAVKNEFFGGGINVTGLLTGTDLFKTLKDVDLGDALLISSSMLRHEGDMFLDDMTLEELSQKLEIKIVVTDNSGESFLGNIINAAQHNYNGERTN